MPGRPILRWAVAALLCAYPFGVYYGLRYFPIRALFVAALVLVCARAALAAPGLARTVAPLGGLVAANLAVGLVLDDAFYLLLNPVMVNLAFLACFAYSLAFPPSFVERIARIRQADLLADAQRYCRRVTEVWCLFFLLNGAVALWTAVFASLSTWTLYNGMISYLLMAALAGCEYAYRTARLPSRGRLEK